MARVLGLDELSAEDMNILEDRARKRIKSRHPFAIKNGLTQQIESYCGYWHKGLGNHRNCGFIPDMTELNRFGRLVIYEIEDAACISERKLFMLERFVMDCYDETFLFVDVVVTDRYGENERIILSTEDTLA